MDAGKLDRRIRIVSRVATQDSAGQPDFAESDVATVWAQRMEQRLAEVFAAGADRAAGTVVWRIRWRDGVTSEMIVIDQDDQRWEISSVAEYGRREGLDLISFRTGESV